MMITEVVITSSERLYIFVFDEKTLSVMDIWYINHWQLSTSSKTSFKRKMVSLKCLKKNSIQSVTKT